jgi:hypothetical protein
MLRAVQVAAGRVRQKPDSAKWLTRLNSALRTAAGDRSVEVLLIKVFAKLPAPQEPSGKRQCLAEFLGRLEAASFLTVDPDSKPILSAHGLTAWLPWIDALAELDVAAVVPAKGTRWPDPALPHLVDSLMPVWTRVTGKSALSTKKIGSGKRKTDRHEFGYWVVQTIIRRAGVQRPAEWSVWTVAQELENKVP